MELLNGDAWRLARHVSTIKAFARNIINTRRQQLAAQQHQHQQQQAAPACTSSSSGGGSAVSSSGGGGVGAGADGGGVAEGPPRDLLTLFMEASGPDGKPLTTQQLLDTVINFIIAGRDTTAQVCVCVACAVRCVPVPLLCVLLWSRGGAEAQEDLDTHWPVDCAASPCAQASQAGQGMALMSGRLAEQLLASFAVTRMAVSSSA